MSDDDIFKISACNGNGKKPDFKNLKDPLGATEAKLKAYRFVDSLLEMGFQPEVVTYAMFCGASGNASDSGRMDEFITMINNYATED